MNNFSFFASGYILEKSGKSQASPIRVGGIISTEDRDSQGEILKSVDWSYFTGGFGKIKYEHKEIVGPDAVIGFPTKLIRKGRETHFEGELVPYDPSVPDDQLTKQQQLAKSVVNLLSHIDDFNKRHPESPQKAGWSVEGEYLSKSKSGEVKARVSNVVFTTKPVNNKTFAQLIKSLETGYGMTPETQTGWGAIAKESLDGKTKNSSNSQQKTGEKRMFKTKSDIYKSFIEEGMKPDEAKKKADEWEANQLKEKGEAFGLAEKSLGNAKVTLEKSLEDFEKYDGIEIDIDVDKHSRSLAKSIDSSNGEVDITAYLQETQRIQLNLLKSIDGLNQKLDFLAGMQKSLAESTLGTIANEDFLRKSIAIADENVANLNKDLATFAKIMQKSFTTKTSGEILSSLSIADNDKVDEDAKQLTKSQNLQVLESLVKSGEVRDVDLIAYEGGGSMKKEVEELVKSKASSILKM